MTSESVSSFLDQARSHRILQPDTLEILARNPDLPQAGLASLSDFLLARGILTRWQAEQIRGGKGNALNFAGYPVVGELGPCPGGVAYKALHPSLRSPIILRRLRADWFAPADHAEAFVARVHAVSPLTHPHLSHLLDAGMLNDEPYVTLDPFDGGDLQTLVADIGPMPTALAAEYLRQAAEGLQVAHDRGVVHGGIWPGCLWAGPLSPMTKTRPDGSPRYRPSATATLKVFDLGLVPLRPAVGLWSMAGIAPTDGSVYLPPERVVDGVPTAAGDVYSLAATTYFLLTGKPPFPVGTVAELVDRLRDGSPTPLAALRPDAPASLLSLLADMMAIDPTARPTLAGVLHRLAHPDAPAEVADVELAPPPAEPTAEIAVLAAVLDDADVAPLEPAPVEWTAVPIEGSVDAELPVYVPPAYTPPQATPGHDAWGGIPEAGFDPTAYHPPDLTAEPTSTPVKPRDPAAEATVRRKIYLWLGIGAGLQVLAVVGWIVYINPPNLSDPPVKKPPAAPATKKATK